jgi:L-ascorbate metabolism protein UlaG (beta-lactamase superfamily)
MGPPPGDRVGGTALASVSFLGHATALLDVEGVRVLTDPVLRARLLFLRRVVAPLSSAAYDGVDVVVISHLHYDHCDVPSLAMLGRHVRIVVPRGGEDFVRGNGFDNVVALAPGESYRVGPVSVTATPAVHDGARSPLGPRAVAVGYLIASADYRIYFAGDTDLFEAMRDLSPALDLALVPVWGWGPNLGPGHLDPVRAATAVRLLSPRRAIPIHWGTFFPYGLRFLYPDRLRVPPRAFARAVAESGQTEVVVLEPNGEPVWLP